MSTEYRAPAQTRIGHVHLKVSDLDRSIAFYRDALGFDVVMRYGAQAAFLSAGGYHHHIGLNTWESLDGSPPPLGTTGLYHFAINYPERKDLAAALKRLIEVNWPIGGASDHGTHEALYLNDPDGIGIELAWDRDPSLWTNADGSIVMKTAALDLRGLLAELEAPAEAVTTPAE
jgi:catechol 2,3-dioxygenase